MLITSVSWREKGDLSWASTHAQVKDVTCSRTNDLVSSSCDPESPRHLSLLPGVAHQMVSPCEPQWHDLISLYRTLLKPQWILETLNMPGYCPTDFWFVETAMRPTIHSWVLRWVHLQFKQYDWMGKWQVPQPRQSKEWVLYCVWTSPVPNIGLVQRFHSRGVATF